MLPWLPCLLLHAAMVGQVLIELPDTSVEKRSAVLRGCQRALGEESCRVTDEADLERTDTLHDEWVRVLWSADGQRAQLRFEGAGTALRELRFSEHDPPAARGEAVGLVIAAHVLSRRRHPAPTDPGEPTSTAPARPLCAADLALSGGPGLTTGKARWGGGLRGMLRLGASPLYLWAELEGARRFDTPRVRFWSGGVGLSLWMTTPTRYVDLQLQATAVAEHVVADAREPSTSKTDRGSRTRGGARLGVELLSCVHPRLCLFGGVRVQALVPTVELEVQDEPVGKLPPLGVGGVLGMRVTGG